MKPPRSFSSLKAFCSHPETFPEKPKKSRDEAADRGTQFHKYIEMWVASLRSGTPFHCDGAAEPVRGWVRKMRSFWTPPKDLETELAVGLSLAAAGPEFVDVVEPEPHEYAPADGETELLTAGRADFVWDQELSYVSVVDMKTGITYLGDPSKVRQILGQGFAVWARAWSRGLRPAGFRPGIYYARLGCFDWGDQLTAGSRAWDEAWRWVREAALRDKKAYPGPWCLGCWDKKECKSYPEAE